jgi:hypothetical protein
MTVLDRHAPAWLIRWEGLVIAALGAAILMGIPVMLGATGLSWDALNHHIYLGWTAEHPRFEQDYMAASYQAYQYPYLYWPAYKLALGGASGAAAGAVLALLQSSVVPAVWRVARLCMPGGEWFHVAMRAMAVALAFMSGVVLSMFDTTANDLLAAIPLVWAFALSLDPLAPDGSSQARVRRAVCWAGLLAGIAVGFKLSNAPVAIVLPLLWLWPAGSVKERLRRLLVAAATGLGGFMLAYGYWGWQLWSHYGNPIYPLYDYHFDTARELLGWTR